MQNMGYTIQEIPLPAPQPFLDAVSEAAALSIHAGGLMRTYDAAKVLELLQRHIEVGHLLCQAALLIAPVHRPIVEPLCKVPLLPRLCSLQSVM